MSQMVYTILNSALHVESKKQASVCVKYISVRLFTLYTSLHQN